MAASEHEIRAVQRALNHFLRDRSLGYSPLMVDGEMGRATRKRIREATWLLGWTKKNRRHAWVTDRLMWALRNPRKTHAWSKQAPFVITKGTIRRGKERRRDHRKAVARNHIKAVFTSGVAHFDGVPVAKWIVPYLRWAREVGHNGVKWAGRLVSGWRDPNYSRGLCMKMCGRPSCPGRCAGLSSNHVGSVRPRGAVDVSDYKTFGWLMQFCPLTPKLINHLGARDPVHFSASGN